MRGSDRMHALYLHFTDAPLSDYARAENHSAALLWYRDACKSEGPEHRFSGQTSRLACVDLSTPIDSEFDRHSKTGLKSTHAILGQKSIFRPGQAQPASDPEFY